jgi:predicted Zn-dependent peptidase
MRLSRLATAICVSGALLAGCASSQSKPDKAQTESETADKQKKAAKAEQSDESAELKGKIDEAIPSLEPLGMRDEAPEAEKVGEQDGVEAFEVGDLTVLHKPTPANQVVSAKLYIDGGVTNLTDETAGIEKLALRTVTNGGSESTPKDEFSSALDSMGSSVSSFTGRDYSGYTLRAIGKHFDDSWGLFTEAILEPAMPKDELQTQRKKQLAQISQIRENPNRLVGYTARKLIADSHPYRHLHLGTEQNVKAFERDHLLAYQRSLLNPERMVLVVVGDISTDEVIEKTRNSFGRLESSEWDSPELPLYDAREPAMDGVEKSLPTNYIMGLFPTPSPDNRDYAATKLALSYLSDRLFEEVRTKRNLSYAVASGMSSYRANYGHLYVSAKRPNETLQVIFDQVDQLKNEKLGSDQLQRTRNVFMTEHYMGLETNSNQADSLARAELLKGDWRKHDSLVEQIQQVTPEDVKRVANEYLDNYQFAVIGKPGSLNKSILGIGEKGN